MASEEALWNAFDLRKVSALLRVINGADWVAAFGAERLASLGVSVDDEPRLNQRIAIPKIMRLLTSGQIEGNCGITLLTNPKGLTFNSLVELSGSPEKGSITEFRDVWDEFIGARGNIPNVASSVVAIPENVFVGSRNKFFDRQEALVHENGCELLNALEISSLLVMMHTKTGESIYPFTYTCCAEHFFYTMVVGGGSPDCINICNVSYGHFDKSIGAGGVLRKF